MAIYRASKGDVMGYEVHRLGRKKRQEYAQKQKDKELSALFETPKSRQIRELAAMFEQRVKDGRRRLGLC
jgi:hypothetical protein